MENQELLSSNIKFMLGCINIKSTSCKLPRLNGHLQNESENMNALFLNG